MPNYFNDSPIENAADDRYSVAPFAKSIAKSILGIKNPTGTTIAVHGPWGSGKSSAVNLIRAALTDSNESTLVVTDFKCWWYRGEEALALAFLQHLHDSLKDGLGDKVKEIIPAITQRLLQAGPVIGQAVSLASGAPLAGLISGASKFAGTFFPKGDTVEKLFLKLAKILAEHDRRFLVIIDDIDRLSPDEAIAIFRLVKSVGRLPNVIYLLVFDRELAEDTVKMRYPSEGPHFLEKIIQASFELPLPIHSDLNDAVLGSVSEICGSPDDKEIVRFMNVFYDAVAPYITTPRHVARFQNAISVTWSAIAGEVCLADFVALEMLRLYEPGLFKAIRLGKDRVCGVRGQGDGSHHDETRFSAFLKDVPEDRRQVAKLALQRLFPRLEQMGYGSDWISTWDAERRVCVEAHFDTYFRLSLSDELLPSDQIDELLRRADDNNFVKETLRQAARTTRKNGKSMVPVYLSELTTHAKRVEREKVQPLLDAVFEIHDEIDLKTDGEKGFMAMANTSLRYHWLIRQLTKGRFTLAERTELYRSVLANAAFGWMVDFVSSARGDYRDRDNGPTREEDCLVAESEVEPMTAVALAKIRALAADGSLLKHPDLMYILYRWREFLGNDPAEARAWTDGLMANDEALVILARAMTSQSWSMGIGGLGSLGDRVSRATTRASINPKTDIFDIDVFRAGLERVSASSPLDEAALADVRTFLNAWDLQTKNPDD